VFEDENMTALFYEDYERLEPGHSWTTSSRTILPQDIRSFAEATGDLNPIHLEPEQARRSGYHNVIAHGYLTISWAAGLVHMLGIDHIASNAILQTDWQLLDVVEANEEIFVELSIVEHRSSRSKPEFGIVTRRFEVKAGAGRNVARGMVTILVFRRDAAIARGLIDRNGKA
jgi:acyl dehydratase